MRGSNCAACKVTVTISSSECQIDPLWLAISLRKRGRADSKHVRGGVATLFSERIRLEMISDDAFIGERSAIGDTDGF
jgi:hypothetical protein